jgi:hypothetical protein
LVDVWLEAELPLDEIARTLTRAIPPGIQIREIQSVSERLPSLQSSMESSEFVVTFLVEQPDLKAQVQRLLEADSLPRTRRNKPYDLHPLIEALEVLPSHAEGSPRLRMVLSARDGATGRPEEVLDCMGIPAEECRVHRTALIFDRG